MIADKIKNARTILYYITILVDESHRLRRYYSKTNHIRDDIFELYEDPDTHIKKPKIIVSYILMFDNHILAGTNPHWIDKSVRWGFSCIEKSR